jgi:DNA-binding CsgD family transcriptional regulator
MVTNNEVIDLAVSVLDAVEDLELPAERVLTLVPDERHARGGLIQDTDWNSAHPSLLHEPTGSSQMVTVGIRGGPDVVAVCLVRDGPDFRPTELDLLAEIQPLLSAMDRHLRRMRTWRASLPESADPPGESVQSAGLTGRETEALLLLSQGLTAAAAARRMCCSISTVNKHLGNVYRKLGVTDRLEAVLEAQRRRLITVTQAPVARVFGASQGANTSTDAELVGAR